MRHRLSRIACAVVSFVALVAAGATSAQDAPSPGTEAAAPAAAVTNAFGDSAADLVYTPVTPCRVFDTRYAAAGVIGAGTARNFLVAGNSGFPEQGGTANGCGIPAGRATAVLINFAAVGAKGPGNLRAWAVANPQPPAPLALVVNFSPALYALANGVAVPICNPAVTSCAAGHLRLQADVSDVHVVGDVMGYFHRTGQTMSGMASARYVPHASSPPFLVADSFPVPLPQTPVQLEYVPGAGTATCPAVGQATVGRLCVYGFNSDNVRTAVLSAGGGLTRWGFSLTVTPNDPAVPGWIVAYWTVSVP